jgi:hypothetical protein
MNACRALLEKVSRLECGAAKKRAGQSYKDLGRYLAPILAGRVPTRSGHPLMLPVMPALGLSMPEGQPHQNS